MGADYYFGGGAMQSTMHPVVLAITLLIVLLVLVSPRNRLFAPLAFSAILTPFGAQLFVGGFHLFVMRIVLLAAGLRFMHVTTMSAEPFIAERLTTLDVVFCLWAFCRAVAVVLVQGAGSVFNQIAFLLDAFGGYFLFRHIIRDREDCFLAMKIMVPVSVVLAFSMAYEHVTGFNVFNLLRTDAIVPWVREGQVRAQAGFAHSILAGSFGATLLPLFFWLWRSGKAKSLGIVGLAASTIVTVTSVSSTPMTAYLCGILALGMWPIRAKMRTVRWGLVLSLLGLALVMKAPVWYVLARVDFVGGHGWDRAFLMDQFARHFADWWLIGTAENANWGYSTFDLCNQFVAEAGSGGLIGLSLFIALLAQGFRMVGRAREQAEGDSNQQWLCWCLGAALFAHVVVFQGVSYFDQTRIYWFAFLAMISAATSNFKPKIDTGHPNEASWCQLAGPEEPVLVID